MDRPRRSWAVVVPVKPLDLAKSRLRDGPAARDALALAMAADTVRALRACTTVAEVVLVTPDRRVARELAGPTVRVVDDPGGGLNAALRHAATTVAAPHLASLPGDLPALRPDDVDRLLDLAGDHRLAVVADADGVGTTLLAAGDPQAFTPAYGPGSFAAHLALGATDLTPHAGPGVRRDVDTAGELLDGRRLGVGEATAALLAARNGGAAPPH